jgi:hypothetical protein
MRMLADTETQARLIREMRDLYEKRGNLEARIRDADVARNLRVQKDALLDIAAYRALHLAQRSTHLVHVPDKSTVSSLPAMTILHGII